MATNIQVVKRKVKGFCQAAVQAAAGRSLAFFEAHV